MAAASSAAKASWRNAKKTRHQVRGGHCYRPPRKSLGVRCKGETGCFDQPWRRPEDGTPCKCGGLYAPPPSPRQGPLVSSSYGSVVDARPGGDE